MTGAAQLINQTSGNTEYYTPIDIVDAARYVMGWIDLDPASSALANARIGRPAPWYFEILIVGVLLGAAVPMFLLLKELFP